MSDVESPTLEDLLETTDDYKNYRMASMPQRRDGR